MLLVVMMCYNKRDLQTILDNALAAHGGHEVLSQFPAITVQFQETHSTNGLDSPLTDTSVAMGAEKNKTTGQLEVLGKKQAPHTVFAGEQGWVRDDKQTREMTPNERAEAKEQAHAAWVMPAIRPQKPPVHPSQRWKAPSWTINRLGGYK